MLKKLLQFSAILLLIIPCSSFADEVINLGDPLGDSHQNVFGRTGDIIITAQPFTPSEDSTSLTATFDIGRIAAETDNVKLEIRTDNSGEPSGVVLGDAEILGTSVANVGGSECNGAVDNETFPTITDLELTNGTQYWAVLSRTGATNTYPNVYVVCMNTDSETAKWSNDTGVTWSSPANDQFSGHIDLIAGEITPPEEPIATSTTSTVGETNQTIFNGVLVFLLSMYFTVWFFRKR